MSFPPPCCWTFAAKVLLSLTSVESHSCFGSCSSRWSTKLPWIRPLSRKQPCHRGLQQLHEAWVGLSVQHLTLFTLLHSVLTDSPECRDDLLNIRTLTASCLLSASLKPITVKQACVKTSHWTASGALLEWESGGFTHGGEVELKWAQNLFSSQSIGTFLQSWVDWRWIWWWLRSKTSTFSSL